MKRGSLLIGVLLIVTVVFIMGVAFLSKQVEAYKGAQLTRDGYLAEALAEAGLEDARIKLEKDQFFPPPGDPSQMTFTYSEDLADSAGKLLGSYTVTIDKTLMRGYAYKLIDVTSVGRYGSRGGPTTTKTLFAEFDGSLVQRNARLLPNPNPYVILRLERR